MNVKLSEILKKHSSLVSHLAGPREVLITQSSSMENPQLNSIVYTSDEKYFKLCIEKPVSAVVISSKLKEKIPSDSSLSILLAEDLHTAMALINQEFFPNQLPPRPFDEQNIHSTAIIAKSAKIGSDVIIGPHVVIEEEVEIADGVKIGANTTLRYKSRIGSHTVIGCNVVIEPFVEIGRDVYIYSTVFIGRHCRLGHQCIIQAQTAIGTEGYGYATDKNHQHHHKPHYGRVILEDRVEVGAGVMIDRGAYGDSVIGEGTKIDNYCHLAHNLTVGKNCLITAGLITAGSVKIGDNCVFAGRVTINGHISITDNVMVGPLSGVSNTISKPGQYGGWPLQSYKESIKTVATLRHLVEIKKEIQQLKKLLSMGTK